MRVAEKVFCRVFQEAFRAALPVLPDREPKLLQEVKMIPKLLQQKIIKRVLLVTDAGTKHKYTIHDFNLIPHHVPACSGRRQPSVSRACADGSGGTGGNV